MIQRDDLIRLFQQMHREHWSYVWGAAEQGCVDCSGAFVYAYRKHGTTIAHGSNAIARHYIRGELLPISQARPGMAAFKLREPGEKGYALPGKYQGDPDQNDYYHIGLVDEDSGYVLNAKSTSQGFCRDKLTAKNGWDAVAELSAVEYDSGGDTQVSYQAKVVGGKLNLRAGKSTSAERICQIPEDSIVSVSEESGGWAKVSYGGKEGWCLAQYLEKIDQDADIVSVSRKALESVYDLIGDWLGMRG